MPTEQVTSCAPTQARTVTLPLEAVLLTDFPRLLAFLSDAVTELITTNSRRPFRKGPSNGSVEANRAPPRRGVQYAS